MRIFTAVVGGEGWNVQLGSRREAAPGTLTNRSLKEQRCGFHFGPIQRILPSGEQSGAESSDYFAAFAANIHSETHDVTQDGLISL